MFCLFDIMAQTLKKLIAVISLALCISLVVYGLKQWHMDPGGDRQRVTSTLYNSASITKNSAEMLDFADFVILLAENEDLAYLSLSISVKLSNSNVCREIEKKKTFIRGAIYGVLDKAAKAGSTQIMSKEQLELDIIDAVNRLLVTGIVVDVYFTKFLAV